MGGAEVKEWYHLDSDPNVSAAQRLGAWLAAQDEESEEDVAQDAVIAYLEQKNRGTHVVRRHHIIGRLLGERNGNKCRPLMSRSRDERLEPLPVWAL
jgi:hypothetical protein